MGEYISLNIAFSLCVCVCVYVMVGGSWEHMGLFARMRGCEFTACLPTQIREVGLLSPDHRP